MNQISNELHGVNSKAIQRVARSQSQELTIQRVAQVNIQALRKKTLPHYGKAAGQEIQGL